MKRGLRGWFECTLEAQEKYVAGEPVHLRFSLHNRANRTLYVLAWYTPLEGIAGEIFAITRDGEAVPYRGILAKRGDPFAGEYVAIEAGGTASAVVDLAQGYDLSRAGRYRVTYTSRLHDVIRHARAVPRKRDAHQPHEVSCGSVEFEIVRPDA